MTKEGKAYMQGKEDTRVDMVMSLVEEYLKETQDDMVLTAQSSTIEAVMNKYITSDLCDFSYNLSRDIISGKFYRFVDDEYARQEAKVGD